MRNRFGGKRRKSTYSGLLFPVLFFAAVLCFFYYALSTTSASVEQEQLASTRQSVRRAAVHCYAVEGQYPPNLQYLEEHYGLRIDENKVIVHYEPIAANLMPNINVFSVRELTEPGAADNSALDADWANLDAGLTVPNAPVLDSSYQPLPDDTDMGGLLLDEAI